MSEEHRPLRERQRDVVRTEIREAALRLFAEHGFAAVPVDTIARTAGVSRSTFFRYFGSKEALLVNETDENAALFFKLLRERPGGEDRMTALEESLVCLAETIRSDERREQMLLVDHIIQTDPGLTASQAAAAARRREEVARVLAEREGRDEPDLEDALAAAILGQITDHIGARWRSADASSRADELIRSHFRSVRRLVGG